MSLVVQVIVTGLAAGAVYGIFAVGYSLIYRLTGVVYFAFGDLVAFGVFTTLLVAAGTGPVSQTSLGFGRFLFVDCIAVGRVRLRRRHTGGTADKATRGTCGLGCGVDSRRGEWESVDAPDRGSDAAGVLRLLSDSVAEAWT